MREESIALLDVAKGAPEPAPQANGTTYQPRDSINVQSFWPAGHGMPVTQVHPSCRSVQAGVPSLCAPDARRDEPHAMPESWSAHIVGGATAAGDG